MKCLVECVNQLDITYTGCRDGDHLTPCNRETSTHAQARAVHDDSAGSRFEVEARGQDSSDDEDEEVQSVPIAPPAVKPPVATAPPAVKPPAWTCHHYGAGEDDNWCQHNAGPEFAYTMGKNDQYPGCGGCWCCKRALTKQAADKGSRELGLEERLINALEALESELVEEEHRDARIGPARAKCVPANSAVKKYHCQTGSSAGLCGRECKQYNCPLGTMVPSCTCSCAGRYH